MFEGSYFLLIESIVDYCFEKAGIPSTLYSINAFKEGAVCIEYIIPPGQYPIIVYEGGKNEKKINITKYKNVTEAFKNFIDRVYAK